jgi:quercetin dioxygenase-like cupin family protein
MAYRVVRPEELEWVEREPEAAGDAPRYVSRLSDVLGLAHTRGSMWRYTPGAKGRRHRDTIQEETFVVLSGTLTMYLGDPPERVDVPRGGVVHVDSGTVLQSANHGDEDALVYPYGAPPEQGGAEFLDSAV